MDVPPGGLPCLIREYVWIMNSTFWVVSNTCILASLLHVGYVSLLIGLLGSFFYTEQSTVGLKLALSFAQV